MTVSVNVCPVCEGPLPQMPPSQRRKFCSRACMGEARRRLPTLLTCQSCQSTFAPTTRYQAARKKTCSPTCAARLQSQQMAGRRPQRQVERIAIPCAQCGALTERLPKRASRTARTYCSQSCRAKANVGPLVANRYNATGTKRLGRYGPANPAWKGGVTYKRPKGNYIGPMYVRCPVELRVMARTDGYVGEHRLVMARRIGRALLRSEVVNHIDHNPRNNDPANLELYPSNGDHKRGEVGRFVAGVANRLYLPDSEPPSSLLVNLLS